jgi:hypothetical protein
MQSSQSLYIEWRYRNELNAVDCLQVGGTGLLYNQWAGITISVFSLIFCVKKTFVFLWLKIIRSTYANKLAEHKFLSDYSS